MVSRIKLSLVYGKPFEHLFDILQVCIYFIILVRLLFKLVRQLETKSLN